MENKKVAALIQARIGSTRLPNKIMLDIAGKPMLWHIVERIKAAKKIEEIILAIPDSKENDFLEKFAKDNKVKYFRGSEQDALSRYYEAAKKFSVDVVVRITSDCPLIDPEIVDRVVEEHLKSGADYTSNIQERNFPKGMDVEALNFGALERADKEARELPEREHVTLYIRRNPKNFKQANIKNDKDLSFMRWTVDEKEDLEFVREIYKRLYREGQIFLMGNIVDLLTKEPKLLEINKDIRRKKI